MTALSIELPGVVLRTAADASQRMSMLLWGPSGVGKTVYACSAPGTKLLINFDPDGPSSLGTRPDVVVMDLSGEKNNIVDKFNSDDPYSISKLLVGGDVATVVVDSTTAYSQLAVEKGISITKGATLERPSPGAYGARNAITLRMMTSLLRLTNKYNTNIIFTSHEDTKADKDGNFLNFSLMLGGKLGSQAALQISEVWHLNETDNKRKVLVRPGRQRTPMKTRMFDTTGAIEFVCQYNQFGKEAPYGKHSIAEFIEEYQANGRNTRRIQNIAP